ncbi:MAG: protein kinase [Acidobacteria bacterium]|nr:protein kinase [Acidobacteriota bacterium]
MSEPLRCGAYELLEPLGRGGMGEVWRARHVLLQRPAAVKRIRAELLGGGGEDAATVLRRFRREVQATSALRSPHTVAVYDYGTADDGAFYYAMELLEGLDLRTLVEGHGPVPPERAVHLLLHACDSLAEAHAAGLTHRDVKPANLFACKLGLQHDFLKVLDFGLVKPAPGSGLVETQLTVGAAAMGSPAFMPPEVAEGAATVDARSDVYSLGCVAYWLLTGKLVFEADTAMRMLMDHVGREPQAPSARAAQPVCKELDEVVLRCLRKRPEERPQNARETAALLRKVPLGRPWTEERAEAWWVAMAARQAAACSEETVAVGEAIGAEAALRRAQGRPVGGEAALRRAQGRPVGGEAAVGGRRSAVEGEAGEPAVGGRRSTVGGEVGEPAVGGRRSAVGGEVGEPAVGGRRSAVEPATAEVERPAPKKVVVEHRERTIAVLQEQFVVSHIDATELSRRIMLAERAGTPNELDKLLQDLPYLPDEVPPEKAMAPVAPAPVAVAPAGSPAPLGTSGPIAKDQEPTTSSSSAGPLVAPVDIPVERSRTMVAVFGGRTKTGKWYPPRTIRAVAAFGGVELDLRNAEFQPGVTTIYTVAMFGGVEVYLPTGMYADINGTGIFGGFDESASSEGRPPQGGKPWVRIRGAAMFGGVDVRVADPGIEFESLKHHRDRPALPGRRERKKRRGSGDDQE